MAERVIKIVLPREQAKKVIRKSLALWIITLALLAIIIFFLS